MLNPILRCISRMWLVRTDKCPEVVKQQDSGHLVEALTGSAISVLPVIWSWLHSLQQMGPGELFSRAISPRLSPSHNGSTKNSEHTKQRWDRNEPLSRLAQSPGAAGWKTQGCGHWPVAGQKPGQALTRWERPGQAAYFPVFFLSLRTPTNDLCLYFTQGPFPGIVPLTLVLGEI